MRCAGSGDYIPRPEDSETMTCDVCGQVFYARPGLDAPIPDHEGRNELANDALFKREEQRTRDYDGGIIWDDDH